MRKQLGQAKAECQLYKVLNSSIDYFHFRKNSKLLLFWEAVYNLMTYFLANFEGNETTIKFIKGELGEQRQKHIKLAYG